MLTAEAQDVTTLTGEAPQFAGFLRSTVKDTWTYRWAIRTFVSNNLNRRYRRSALGFCWGLIGPLFTMAIMSVVFSLIFHADPKKFTIYVFSGLLPWTFMLESAMQGSNCLVGAEPYLKKLFIPKIFFPLVSLGTDTVNTVFAFASLLVLGMIVGVQFHWSLLALPLAIGTVALFNLGLVLLYGVSTVYFRDLPHILTIIYSGLFYSLPIIYPMTAIPEKYHALFKLNPMYWFINLFRRIIYDGVYPTVMEWCIPLAIAASLLIVGLSLLRITERNLIYRL